MKRGIVIRYVGEFDLVRQKVVFLNGDLTRWIPYTLRRPI